MLFDQETIVAKLNTRLVINRELATHLPMTGLIHYYCLATGRTDLTNEDFQLLSNNVLRYPISWFRYWYNLYKSSDLIGKTEEQLWDESYNWENKSSSYQAKLVETPLIGLASYFSSRLESTRKVTVHVGILRELKQAAKLYYYLRWSNPTASGSIEYTHAEVARQFRTSSRTIRRWHSALVKCGAIIEDESKCLDYATGHYKVHLGSIKKIWYNLSEGGAKSWGASARVPLHFLQRWGVTKTAVIIETQHLQQASQRQAIKSLSTEGKYQTKVILPPDELVNGNRKPSRNNKALLTELVERKSISQDEATMGGKQMFYKISSDRVWVSDRLVTYGGSQATIQEVLGIKSSNTVRKHLDALDRKQVFQEVDISPALLKQAREMEMDSVNGVTLSSLYIHEGLAKVFKPCPNIYDFSKVEKDIELTGLNKSRLSYLIYAFLTNLTNYLNTLKNSLVRCTHFLSCNF